MMLTAREQKMLFVFYLRASSARLRTMWSASFFKCFFFFFPPFTTSHVRVVTTLSLRCSVARCVHGGPGTPGCGICADYLGVGDFRGARKIKKKPLVLLDVPPAHRKSDLSSSPRDVRARIIRPARRRRNGPRGVVGGRARALGETRAAARLYTRRAFRFFGRTKIVRETKKYEGLRYYNRAPCRASVCYTHTHQIREG